MCSACLVFDNRHSSVARSKQGLWPQQRKLLPPIGLGPLGQGRQHRLPYRRVGGRPEQAQRMTCLCWLGSRCRGTRSTWQSSLPPRWTSTSSSPCTPVSRTSTSGLILKIRCSHPRLAYLRLFRHLFRALLQRYLPGQISLDSLCNFRQEPNLPSHPTKSPASCK